MDLVKSYDSEMDDDSDIEEIKLSPKKSTKEVDVINLESDSEGEINNEKDKNIENVESQKKSCGDSKKEIDCIDLDEGTTPEKQPPTKETSPKEVSSKVAKKIDYLNLEDSGSDMECENNEKSIVDLIETASKLSDTSCGPAKPPVLDNVSENMSLDKELDVAESSTGIDSDYNSTRNTPDFVHSNTSLDSSENYNIQGDLDNPQLSKNLSCIFRDDNRVIEAGKKNIVCRIPRQIIQTHNAHSNVITSLSWCTPHFSYLYLSASQDGSLKIWDLYRTNSVQCIKTNTGLNSAKWSLDGGQIIAGGIGKKAYVYDVQTGKKINEYDIYNVVASIEVHPYMEDVFLCGTRNAILGFDIRVNTTFPIRTFISNCEEVLDIAFLDENEFICSTNIVSHDSADRTIMAWDFPSGAILSNQIYLERFTCPSLKVHPTDSSFVAQTNGNYIVAFSTSRPYKMKKKRYTGHKVSGYGVECDISPDGKYVVSGDVDGSMYFYNYSNTNTVLVTPKRKVPTNRVKWHPVFSSTLVSSTYDGQIHIWK